MLEDELGPGIAAALARTADQLRDDTALLDDLAATALEAARRPGGLDVEALAAQPPSLRHRVLHARRPRGRRTRLRAAPAATCSRSTGSSSPGAASTGSTCPATCAPCAATACW